MSIWLAAFVAVEVVVVGVEAVGRVVVGGLVWWRVGRWVGRCSQGRLDEMVLWDRLEVGAPLGRVLAFVIMVFFYNPGMPLLNILATLYLFLHTVSLTIRIYHNSTRSHLPPSTLYIHILTFLKYLMVLHLIIGAYMYSCILGQ